jgi:hypothetical protein
MNGVNYDCENSWQRRKGIVYLYDAWEDSVLAFFNSTFFFAFLDELHEVIEEMIDDVCGKDLDTVIFGVLLSIW